MAGEYQWPRHVVALLDELKLYGVPDEQILAVGDALRDAAYATVYAGNAAPAESLGEVLAMEAVAEGEANRDTAKLLDAPHCPSRRRTLLQSISYHISAADRARRVLLRDQGRSTS